MLHAGWGSFADGGRTLCVLQAAELTTVSDGGQVNTLPLAAAYTRVWSLPAGILLTVGCCHTADAGRVPKHRGLMVASSPCRSA